MAYHIVIDPGHGGYDKGAVSHSHIESQLTLRLAKQLQNRIQSTTKIKATLTRTKNIPVSLPQRTQLANKAGADLYISIHANASRDPRAKGAEFYFQNALSTDVEAMYLAKKELHSYENEEMTESDQKEITQTEHIINDLKRGYNTHLSSLIAVKLSENWMGLKKRSASPIKQAPFFVISNTKMPSVLVEVGFITHPKESKKLAQQSYQKQIVDDIYRAIIKYKAQIDEKAVYKF